MGLDKIKKAIKEPKKLLLYLCNYRIYNWMPDKMYLKYIYRLMTGKKLRLDPPVTFNEKIQWLKLYDRKEIYSSLVDKYEVRQYIAQRIGEKYLVPLLGVWDSQEDVDFNSLPQQFVLKPTHTSGNVLICRDKDTLDQDATRQQMREWLKRDYFWGQREWPYKNTTPRIIAEKMIDEKIVDYKFYCFNGEPKLLYLSRGLEDHATAEISFFDLELKKLPFGRSDYRPYDVDPEKPDNFAEMLSIARELAKDFKFMRVDLYSVGGNTYFSELTFHPCSGYMPFEPQEYDEILGGMLNLEL